MYRERQREISKGVSSGRRRGGGQISGVTVRRACSNPKHPHARRKEQMVWTVPPLFRRLGIFRGPSCLGMIYNNQRMCII